MNRRGFLGAATALTTGLVAVGAAGCSGRGDTSPSVPPPSPPGPSASSLTRPAGTVTITQGTVGGIGIFRLGFVNEFDGMATFLVWSEEDPLGVESRVVLPASATVCLAGAAYRADPGPRTSRAVRDFVPVDPPIDPPGERDITIFATGSAVMLGVAKVVIVDVADGRATLLVDVTADGPSTTVTAVEGEPLTLGEHTVAVTRVRAGSDDVVGYVAFAMAAG